MDIYYIPNTVPCYLRHIIKAYVRNNTTVFNGYQKLLGEANVIKM